MTTRVICGDCGVTMAVVKTPAPQIDRERVALCRCCKVRLSIEQPKKLLRATSTAPNSNLRTG